MTTSTTHTLFSNSHLAPGGWLEIKDICFPILDNDDSFPEDCAVKKWSDLIVEGTTKLGRPANSAKQYKLQLEAAGFENVVEKQYRWPQNRWPKDKKMKELGVFSPLSYFTITALL